MITKRNYAPGTSQTITQEPAGTIAYNTNQYFVLDGYFKFSMADISVYSGALKTLVSPLNYTLIIDQKYTDIEVDYSAKTLYCQIKFTDPGLNAEPFFISGKNFGTFTDNEAIVSYVADEIPEQINNWWSIVGSDYYTKSDVDDKINDINTVETTILSGFEITNGLTNTTINIAEGIIHVTDTTDLENVLRFDAVIPAKTNVEVYGITTKGYTTIQVDLAGGTIQTVNTDPSNLTGLNLAPRISVISHILSSTVEGIAPWWTCGHSPASRLNSVLSFLGVAKQGCTLRPFATDLRLALDQGKLLMEGLDANISNEHPDIQTVPAQAPVPTIIRAIRNNFISVSNITIDAGNYDLNGTLTTIGGPAGTSTIQRVYLTFSNNIIIQYGQNTYSSLASATTAFANGTDTYVENPVLKGVAIRVGYIIVTRSANNLASSTNAIFKPTDRWGDSAGSSSTSTIPSLDQVLIAGNDAGAKKISNLADGTFAQDAVTKAQLDLKASKGVVNTVQTSDGAGNLKDSAVILTNNTLLIGTESETHAGLRLGQTIGSISVGNYGGASFTSYNNTFPHYAPIFDLNRSKGTTAGSMTSVANGDALGYLVMRGSDGTNFVDGGYISGYVDGVPTTGNIKGALDFVVNVNGSAMKIRNNLNVNTMKNLSVGGVTASTIVDKWDSLYAVNQIGGASINYYNGSSIIANNCHINGGTWKRSNAYAPTLLVANSTGQQLTYVGTTGAVDSPITFVETTKLNEKGHFIGNTKIGVGAFSEIGMAGSYNCPTLQLGEKTALVDIPISTYAGMCRNGYIKADASTWVRTTTGASCLWTMNDDGSINFYNTPSGASGTNIAFTNPVSIINGGIKTGNVTTKTVKLTGVTASTQGALVSIPTGLGAGAPGSKVHVKSCKVNHASDSWIASESYSHTAGCSFSVVVEDSGNVVVANTEGNSSAILSKPISILIEIEV